MTVTVYTKPACVQCNATYKALDKQGIAYEKVDISLLGRYHERFADQACLLGLLLNAFTVT